MPLIKKTVSSDMTTAMNAAPSITAEEVRLSVAGSGGSLPPAPIAGASLGIIASAEPKPVYTGRKAAPDTMSKDDYWRQREERDIQKSKEIGRAGLYQAALQSVGVLQYSPDVRSLEDYLKAVRKAAEDGLKFVAEAE